MTRYVITKISLPLYNEIKKEKRRLQEKQKKKKTRKKHITMVIACQSILNKIR